MPDAGRRASWKGGRRILSPGAVGELFLPDGPRVGGFAGAHTGGIHSSGGPARQSRFLPPPPREVLTGGSWISRAPSLDVVAHLCVTYRSCFVPRAGGDGGAGREGALKSRGTDGRTADLSLLQRPGQSFQSRPPAGLRRGCSRKAMAHKKTHGLGGAFSHWQQWGLVLHDPFRFLSPSPARPTFPLRAPHRHSFIHPSIHPHLQKRWTASQVPPLPAQECLAENAPPPPSRRRTTRHRDSTGTYRRRRRSTEEGGNGGAAAAEESQQPQPPALRAPSTHRDFDGGGGGGCLQSTRISLYPPSPPPLQPLQPREPRQSAAPAPPAPPLGFRRCRRRRLGHLPFPTSNQAPPARCVASDTQHTHTQAHARTGGAAHQPCPPPPPPFAPPSRQTLAEGARSEEPGRRLVV